MKLIKLSEEHYIIVDASEIKEGDYYFSKMSDNIFRRIKDGHWIENYDKKMYQKITHSTQPLNCNCSNRDYKLDSNCAERNHCFNKIQYLSLQEVKELIGEKSWKGYIDGTEWEVEIVDGKLKLK